MWRCTWFHWIPAEPVRFTVVQHWSHNPRWVSTKASEFLSLQTPWWCAHFSCPSARWDLRLRRNYWWVWNTEQQVEIGAGPVAVMQLRLIHLNWDKKTLCVNTGHSPVELGRLWGKRRDGLPLAASPDVEWDRVSEAWTEKPQPPQTRRQPRRRAKTQDHGRHLLNTRFPSVSSLASIKFKLHCNKNIYF